MIAKNTFYNFLGLGLPLIVAIFTIPVLIDTLGVARFGVLTLVWAIVSYASLLDMGLGRALTLELSTINAKRKYLRIPKVIGTTYLLMLGIGIVLGLVVFVFSSSLTELLKGLDDRNEVIKTMQIMAVTIPFVILSAGSRGILEAYSRFDIVNLIRVPIGVMTFLGPVLVLWFWDVRLDYIAVALFLIRVISFTLYFWYAQTSLPIHQRKLKIDLRYSKSLVINGGWMTVSNVMSPLMGYLDRFLIGGLIGAAAVSYYATPHEIITKLWIIPGALAAVLFPIFASRLAGNEKSEANLYSDSVNAIFFIMLPLCAFFMLFEQEILTLWVGASFATESKYILLLLSLGMLINGLAIVPFTYIQGKGKAKVTAYIHLAEFPAFISLLWWLLNEVGVVGAAIAWVIRLLVDTVLMLYFAFKYSENGEGRIGIRSIMIYVFSIAFLTIVVINDLDMNLKALVEFMIAMSVLIYFVIEYKKFKGNYGN